MDERIWYRELAATPHGLRTAEAWEGVGGPGSGYVDRVPADAVLIWRSAPSADGLLQVGIPFERVPDAPPLWFVAVDEPRGRPPACILAAYRGDELPDGTVVGAHGFAQLGVPADAQLGEVRWFRDGLVHHIHVAPEWRRRDIGTSLLHAAGSWHQAMRWPGFLHAGARRTRLTTLLLARLGLHELLPPTGGAHRRD